MKTILTIIAFVALMAPIMASAELKSLGDVRVVPPAGIAAGGPAGEPKTATKAEKTEIQRLGERVSSLESKLKDEIGERKETDVWIQKIVDFINKKGPENEARIKAVEGGMSGLKASFNNQSTNQSDLWKQQNAFNNKQLKINEGIDEAKNKASSAKTWSLIALIIVAIVALLLIPFYLSFRKTNKRVESIYSEEASSRWRTGAGREETTTRTVEEEREL